VLQNLGDTAMTERVKLTSARVGALRCAPGQTTPTVYWDADLKGFGLRVSPQGKAVYFAQYRDKLGKQAKQSLGEVGTVRAEQARDAARTILSKVQLGGNPQRELQEQRQGDRVVDLVGVYLAAAKGRLRPRSYLEVERALTKAAKPLHHLKAETVTRREIAALIDKLAAESGPFAANRTRANLSAMWTWALRGGRVDSANPVAFTNVATREVARDRVLGDDELALIWRSTDGGHDHDRIVRLLMLTAARRDEVGAMQWPEIADVTGGGSALWTLPSERAKNGLVHEVHLSPLAIEQMPDRRGDRAGVFGRAEGQATGFSGWSKCKARLDARMRAVGHEQGRAFTTWRLHDLRRTFSTWANENDVEPHVVEAVLNHVSGVARRGVAGVYNKAQYRTQKAAALAAWEAHLRLVCGLGATASNVTPMRASV
jgi:integrase